MQKSRLKTNPPSVATKNSGNSTKPERKKTQTSLPPTTKSANAKTQKEVPPQQLKPINKISTRNPTPVQRSTKGNKENREPNGINNINICNLANDMRTSHQIENICRKLEIQLTAICVAAESNLDSSCDILATIVKYGKKSEKILASRVQSDPSTVKLIPLFCGECGMFIIDQYFHLLSTHAGAKRGDVIGQYCGECGTKIINDPS